MALICIIGKVVVTMFCLNADTASSMNSNHCTFFLIQYPSYHYDPYKPQTMHPAVR